VHFSLERVANKTDKWKRYSGYYHRRLEEVLQFVVPPEQRVIEIGCGRGDLLAALNPSYGVSVDFSAEIIRRAKYRYHNLNFFEADAHELIELLICGSFIC
jgi:Methylase involved in ubiquinone/menaquinone biosynthesis